MNGYALVIGSQTHDLNGVVSDATRMAAALTERGLAVDLRLDSAATRAGILDGCDALIAKARANDAAVVYYAGHGTLAINPRVNDRIRVMQAIVPTDVPGSAEFRAITTWELGIKLQQLTARTRNVTVILDCCHAAQMTRDGAVRRAIPRALPHPIHAGFREHVKALEAMYGRIELDSITNPDAVRLVACAQSESAYEYIKPDGMSVGVFTDTLLEVLDEVGTAEISWAAIGDAVRARVLARFPSQRPDVEGPSQRLLFSLDTDDRTGIVPVEATGGQIRIHSGQLLGTHIDDCYGAMPLGSTKYDETRAIAALRVTAVAPLHAIATAEWKNEHRAVPPGSVAVPLELTAPTCPVALTIPQAERATIVRAIAASRTLRVAEANETTAPLARLRLAGDRLTVEDAAGPIFPAARYPASLANAIENVANLRVARRIRELVGEHGISSRKLDITWGAVTRGQPRAMPEHGASLGLADRIYLKVRNTGSEPRYVHIFNVGVRGKVTLLTRNLAPAGFPLNNTQPELVLGEQNGQLVGLTLYWPSGLPQDTFPRTDEIYVFVTAEPVSLHHLETREYSLRGVRGVTRGSRLQELLAQVQDGVKRNVDIRAKENSRPLESYLVRRLSYQLHPRQAAMADLVAFQIDENPQQHAAARSPDAWLSGGDVVTRGVREPAASRAIAIRIEDLVVQRERTLRVPDIRIDTLICTRSTEQARAITTRTMRFHGISDGEQLGRKLSPIFHGPVRDFVDIYLWLSRDAASAPDLAELFAQRAADPAFRDAAAALLARQGTAGAPWVLAAGASAALARIACDLIEGSAGATTGLYRTSFSAAEQFGIGRHPTEGLYCAQDFSFSLLVEPVSPATN